MVALADEEGVLWQRPWPCSGRCRPRRWWSTRDVHEVTGPGTMEPMLQASTWEPTAPLMAQLPAPA